MDSLQIFSRSGYKINNKIVLCIKIREHVNPPQTQLPAAFFSDNKQLKKSQRQACYTKNREYSRECKIIQINIQSQTSRRSVQTKKKLRVNAQNKVERNYKKLQEL